MILIGISLNIDITEIINAFFGKCYTFFLIQNHIKFNECKWACSLTISLTDILLHSCIG